MKIISNMILCVTCVAVLCVGCQSAKPVESTVSIDDAVAGLVPPLVQNALASRCFSNGEPPVMAVGRILNDTVSIRGGTLDLMKAQMIEMFSASGKVSISSAFGAEEKEMKSLASGAKIKAPSLVLSGKLTQRTLRREDGGRQLEFFLELSIVDITSGNLLWNGKRNVGFAVDKDARTW